MAEDQASQEDVIMSSTVELDDSDGGPTPPRSRTNPATHGPIWTSTLSSSVQMKDNAVPACVICQPKTV